MIIRRLTPGLLLAAFTASSLMLPALAIGADPRVQLQTEAQQREDGAWMLVATVKRGGAVQSQQTVEFFQIVEFFGERSVPLGTAVTDAAGTASRLYRPRTNGSQQIVARYEGGDGLVESEPFEIVVAGVDPLLPGEGPVLPIIQAWAFPVGLAVLIIVWLGLATILLRAVLGVGRAGRGGL